MRTHPLLAIVAMAIVSTSTFGQSPDVRYDLGRRVRAMERAFEAADLAGRTRALPHLKSAVTAYFSMRTGGVAKRVDEARIALRGGESSPRRLAAAALHVVPSARLHAPTDTLSADLRAAYDVPVDAYEGLTATISLVVSGKPTIQHRVALTEGPKGIVSFPLADVPEGDHRLRWSVHHEDNALDGDSILISVVKDARNRVSALAAATEDGKRTIEHLTARALAVRCKKLLGGCEETDFPIARLLAEANETITDKTPWYDEKRTGQHWLVLPTGSRSSRVRIQVPSNVTGKRPAVVALHGAGGSENLFFDGYGDGKIARMCAERGWYLITTRAGFGAPDVTGVLETLRARYPIDAQKIFLIGHSMGAGHLVTTVRRAPTAFRACAALSGGGRVRSPEALDAMPFLCGAGKADFGLSGVRRLHRTLDRESRTGELLLRVYEGAEHLTAVQIALEDAFGLFERALQ